MKHIEAFHKSFNILWEYRLQNISLISRDVHQIILTLSICDFYMRRQNKVEISEYEFIKERVTRSYNDIIANELIWNNLNVCLEIIEAFILMEKLYELGN